ncbi:hypothetical protein ACF0H5_010186 [Mactra antiquata]
MDTYRIHGLFSEIGLNKNTYMVIAPDAIRPSMEYTIQFNKLSPLPPLRLMASLVTPSEVLVSAATVVSANAKNALLTLYILPYVYINGDDLYNLEITATSMEDDSLLFKNSTSLRYMEKHISIFIQTDKAMYKPGQNVQFRAFVTNPDLSILYETMDISIYDPHNNKIQHWLNVNNTNGVFQDSLQLSDQPPLGIWKIEVTFMGTSKTQEIEVAEYVLPRFEVKVSLPGFGLESHQYLSGKVDASYTFGKGVEGNGTLTITSKYGYPYDRTFRERFKINGIYKFNIPMKTLTDTFGSLSHQVLIVTASVEEGLTSKTEDDTAEIQYYTKAKKLMFLDSATYFKPGLKYTAYVFVSDQDDKPLSTASTVTFIVDMNDATGKVYSNKTFDVSPNGIVAFSFNVGSTVHSVSLTAESSGAYTAYKYLTKFNAAGDSYIQVSVQTRNPQTGRSCAFQIRSTLTYRRYTVNYMIVAKGLIVKQGKVTMRRRRPKSFAVTLTSETSPTAKCIVYLAHKTTAEVIADSVMFNVKRNFDNKVQVDYVKPNGMRATRSAPGKKMNIRVRADAGSLCNVLTVDKSVLLLKSGNDVTPAKIEDEMELYDNKPPQPCGNFICLRSYFPVPINGQDVTQVFMNSGLKVLTDAYMYQYIHEYRYSSYPWYYDGADYYSALPSTVAMAAPSDIMEADSPNAESANAKTTSNTRVRSHFPETWIFDSATANGRGKAIIKTRVPDTITTWISSAFAVNKDSGLGLALNTAELTAFLKFFVQLSLPYSVIRSEQVILQANVFNYFDTDLVVDVTLKESTDFQVIIISNDMLSRTRSRMVYRHQEVVHTVTIPSGSAVAVNFPIIPLEIGNIDIEVTAVSSMAGDAVRRQLLVEAEGIESGYNLPILIEAPFATSRKLPLPPNIVEGSLRIRISATGDLMGPSISGLSSLLRMPYGCGEQNMLGFVPNIVVMKYLSAVNYLKPEDESKAKKHMLIGYQKELTYQHDDGSFSAFGNNDPSGSTWLTAFVMKSFVQARPYIYIDPEVIKQSIDWLLARYTKSGLFNEPGNVIHKDMQFEGSVALDLDNVIKSAIGVLEGDVDTMEDVFELAIASYCLALIDSPKVENVIIKLFDKATVKDGYMYWTKQESEETTLDMLIFLPPNIQSSPRSIETTAYVLLTFSHIGRITDGLPIMKWLVNQRNSNGGFGSTQDTMIALQALAEFAKYIYSDDVNIVIDVEDSNVQFEHTFRILPEDVSLYQRVSVPETSRKLNFTASGNGKALVEIAVSYNVMENTVVPMFKLVVSSTDETLSGFNLQICFKYLGEGASGMSVLEIKLLSGFSAEKTTISKLSMIKRVEDGNKLLYIYLNQVPGNETSCITVHMQRQNLVANTQPGTVKLYDYYDNERPAFRLYQPDLLKDTNVCSLSRDLGC